MKTATIDLGINGSVYTSTRNVTASPKELARTLANVIRAYARIRGVSPMAVDYKLQLH